MGEIDVNRIHNGNEVVHDDVGIIGHSVGDNVLTFEQVDIMVVDADVENIFCDLHCKSPYVFLMYSL